MADDDEFDVEIEETDEVDAEEKEEKKGSDRDSRAVNAARAARKERDQARRELAELRAKATKNDEAKPDDAERDRAADERALARVRPRLVAAEGRAALVAAGAKADRVRRLVKLLDVDEVDVNEAGEVDEDSLDAEVERLKEEWPELFAVEDDKPKTPVRRRVDGGTGTGAKAGAPKRSSSTAALAAALTGSKRR